MSSPPSHTNPRRRAMSSPPAHPDAGDPASQLIFTDEILGEIFLRLDAAADVARASAACTAFLRRNRSLYHQPVVGFLECEGRTRLHPRSFYHAQQPHRSASAARDLAEAADFNCSFLPEPGSWLVYDATGGRLLLSSRSPDNTSDFTGLVVCDPLPPAVRPDPPYSCRPNSRYVRRLRSPEIPCSNRRGGGIVVSSGLDDSWEKEGDCLHFLFSDRAMA
ncbi:uncharacterized protein [Miscanthus floridulus]|uniref:uncharacterized protein n=1 Tax=Miscanthus floridulus TaxID=154761 RepID=UPI0034588E7F